jgi:Ala-tRNA(Pro) deacylase
MSTVHFNMGNDGLARNRFGVAGLTEIPKRLINCLNDNNVQYEILHEPQKYSGQEGSKVGPKLARYHAKVIMVRTGRQHLMTVLPVNCRIDFENLEKFVGGPVRLETEEEFKWLFPDCAIGVMPPFGNLYGLPTYLDSELSKNDYIVFAAGTFSDHIKISYRAYERIVQPRILRLSRRISSRHAE